MKYFTNSNNIPQALFSTRNWGNQQSKLSFIARFFVLLFIIQYVTFNVAYAQCAGGTPSVMAKWTFDSYAEQCNGAVKRVPNPLGGGMLGRIYPILQVNTATYCPDLNAGCAQTVLGSKGFNNTTNYNNAICLWGFYDLSVGLAPGWVATDPTFHPEIPANLSVWYDLAAGKAGSLTGFSIQVIQQQYDGSTVNFEKQGVGVYRNGVLIYSTTQPITAANVNGTPISFTFPSIPEFYSDGSAAVKFEIVFGLVNRLITNNTSGTRITGYDNISVLGTCGASPMPAASISPATCSASGSNTDGKITLSNFGATDHFDYNVGATYTGGKAYASAAAIPAGGVITSSLPNPASPTVYTVRVFSADGCTKDLQVTLNPTSCPVACTPPTATAAPTDATCAGVTANNDAKITISGFGATDTYQYSTGATFTAASATPASATVVPAGGVIASTLANPAAVQTYTVRIYGAGSTSCYVDRVVSVNPKSCTVACTTPTATATGTGATCTGNSPNKDAKITLSGFGATDTYQYSVGSSFSAGSATPAAATVIPASGIIANTLANPTSPITYTVRIYAAGVSTCFADRTVTITPTICTVPCTPPTATVAATSATCVGTGMNAQIAITGITGGDKVGLSVGSTYTGATYSTAQAATSSYTFSNLPNPQGSQIYTVRVYNGGDNCFKDYPVTITETICGACKKYGIEIICSDQADANSTVNNSITTEDDFTTYEICKDTKKIDLKLTKTVTPTTGTTCPVGTEFTWTITITNAGDMTATNIQVADFMSPKMIVTASTPNAGTTYSDRSGWLIPSLAGSGATATLTIKTKALVAGTLTNCAEIMEAFPLNDPNSTPANGVITEDDYACASITVTGPNTPEISKEFSPMQTKANIPTRLIIKITNNETTPITTTAALVDNLPSTPAQMVIATTPNLATGLTGVIATAGGTSITIPSGTVLLPGLNQIAVDVIVPSDGYYCNTIAAGALKTTSCDNVLEAKACLDADVNFEVAPIITKTMLPATIQTGQNAMLTIKIENRNSAAMTLNQDFVDFLPTGLVANGAVAGTCTGVSLQNTNTEIKMASGSSIPANSSCTITVPVTSSTAGSYCNIIRMNSLITTVGTNTYLGNQDQAEACITVTATPCTAIDLTSITQAPTGTITTGGTVNLTAVGTGTGTSTVYTWSAPSGTFSTQANPTVWTAPTTAGSYTVKVVGNNSLTGYGVCKDSVTLAITVGTACTPPSFNAYGIAATCNGTSANSDAQINLYQITNGTKVGYSAGVTYTGPAYSAASSITGTTASITGLAATNIGGSKYTVRVFNGSDACYKDILVIVPYSDCNALCTVDAGADQLLCSPTSTVDLKDAAANEEWIVDANNPAAATINASTGVVAGMSVNGAYSFILRDKVNTSCSDIVYVFRNVVELPAQSSCDASYQLPTVAGVTWSVVSGSATVSASGLVSGMSTNGLYRFSATFTGGCTSTVDVNKITCVVNCVTPNAGADVTMCLPKTSANLIDATSGYEWVVVAGNPAAAIINASTGVVTGMTAVGTYKFRLQKTGDATCFDEIQITQTTGDAAIALCNDGSTAYTITAQNGLTNVIWYNMAGTQVGTDTTLIVKSTTVGLEDGTEAFYYVGQSTDPATSGCDVELCCPVKFITQACCPTPNCGTVTIIKN